MNSKTTESVVRSWYDHLINGEMDALLDGMSEDVTFEIPKFPHNAIVPWAGLWKGRDQVLEAFQHRNEVLELEAFELKTLVAEGDTAFALIHERSINITTGKPFDIMISQELTVRDNQVATWIAYYDSYPVIASFHQHDTSTQEGLNAEIILAVGADDVTKTQNLLAIGANANARAEDTGLTLLMMAATQANAELVTLLLQHGADVLTTDSKTGATPLHKACQGGSVEVARALVEAGAFIDAVTPTMGHTPIMDALWYKWPEMVRFLVEQNANLNLSTHYGFSMMEHFQFELNVNVHDKDKLLEIDAIFKEKQAQIDEQIGQQSLMAAANEGDLDKVRDLIAQESEVNAVYPHVNSFSDGHTPLLVAARDAHTDIVGELIKAGADVTVVDWVFKGSPIHKATYNGNPEILKLILDAPNVDIDVQGPINGYTPIHDALWHGYIDCTEILLEAGARLDLKGHDGKRPLEVAIDTLGTEHPIIAKIRSSMQAHNIMEI